MERLPTERALTEQTRKFKQHQDHPQDARKENLMTGAQFGSFILGLVVVAIVVAIGVWLLHWLYLRSSKERAFVRTGLGGQKVVLNGGAFVLPIVHDVLPVNMNTLRLEVSRGRDKALITKDRMRVDVTAEFYVRVQATVDAIANAAQTLGQRTLQPESLKELLEGKFVDALRTVAAELTMEELHEKRGEYVKRVRAAVAGDLLNNGLELESASLTQLDQTSMEFFNPSNAFDAEGLTRLTEQIERRKKQRNDIEQDTLIQIRNKNLEAEKMSLDIDRDSENARLAQERELEIARAAQRSELARERAEPRAAGRARADHRARADRARAHRHRPHARGGPHRQGARDPGAARSSAASTRDRRAAARHRRRRAVARAERGAGRGRPRARALGHRRGEGLHRARDRGGRAPPPDRAHRARARTPSALKTGATAEADAEKIRALAAKIRAEVEADGVRMMNEARNILSPQASASALRMRLLEKVEGDRAREREADGAHREHPHPARGRPGRRRLGRRRRRRAAARAWPTTW